MYCYNHCHPESAENENASLKTFSPLQWESGFTDGRREASPDSEKPKPTNTKCCSRMALSAEQIQDRTEILFELAKT